jgi:UDP-3-O-[3-hydroxymyristoyl] glucosamine N-acyltransferase
MAEMTLQALAEAIGGQLEGDGSKPITGIASLEDATSSEVAFLANDKYVKFMAETDAAAVIVAADYAGAGPALIRCDDPYFAFQNAMVTFYGFRTHPFTGISDQASISPEATVSSEAHIGPFVTVCEGATVGKGTVLYPGTFVGPRATVGEDCILYANVTIYDDCVLGDRVTIHANSSIGQDGFGYATHGAMHHKLPAVGNVILGNDVEIGACCAIDRATLGSTTLGDGTKFSNHISIGHGSKMGKHCLMVAQSGIAGSTNVGNYVVFAAQCGSVGHITIGDGAKVGAQAGVVGSVEPGQEVLGSPAIPIQLMRRIAACYPKLPDMRSSVRRLERELAQLRSQMGLAEQESD